MKDWDGVRSDAVKLLGSSDNGLSPKEVALVQTKLTTAKKHVLIIGESEQPVIHASLEDLKLAHDACSRGHTALASSQWLIARDEFSDAVA